MSRFSKLEFQEDADSELGQESVVKDGAYYSARAWRAFEEMDFEAALRLHSKVLEFDPNQAAAWTGQTRALIELGEFREAKVWSDKALEKFPHEPELLAAKAVALARCGDLEAALAFSDASIEERGDSFYVWLARADVLLARKETLAEYCFDKALHVAPQNWLVSWLAARIRYFYQQFSIAMKFARQAVEWNPAASAAWVMLGQCQQALGFTDAGRSFEQAAQLNPRCQHARRGLRLVSNQGSWLRWKRQIRHWFS